MDYEIRRIEVFDTVVLAKIGAYLIGKGTKQGDVVHAFMERVMWC